jgi:hypothetical protein
MATSASVIPALLERREKEVLASWLENQISAGSLRSGQIKEGELKDQSQRFLREFVQALKSGEETIPRARLGVRCGSYLETFLAHALCRVLLLRRLRRSSSP